MDTEGIGIKISFTELDVEHALNFTQHTDKDYIEHREFPCLSKEDVDYFNKANRDASVRMHKPAGSPCTDCSLDYQQEMIEQKLCRRPGMTVMIDAKGNSTVFLGAPVVIRTDVDDSFFDD